MDLSQLTYDELCEMQLSKNIDRVNLIEEISTIGQEIAKRDRVEKLKAQFAGLSEEEVEILKNAMSLSPSSIKTEEKAKL